jgi:hypothetical protein
MIGEAEMLQVMPARLEGQLHMNRSPSSNSSHAVPAWQFDGWHKSLKREKKMRGKEKKRGEKGEERVELVIK